MTRLRLTRRGAILAGLIAGAAIFPLLHLLFLTIATAAHY